MTFILKVFWNVAIRLRSGLYVCLLKALQGTLITRIDWRCRLYGWITFGTVPTNVVIGACCSLGRHLFLATSKTGRIVLNEGCSINTGAHIVALTSIEIGSNTSIGEYVTIRDQNHRFADSGKPVRGQGYDAAPIKIGNNVWVGRGVFIGPGVEVGDGAIIGANSVVTSSIPALSIAAGAPARVIRMRT